MAKVRGQFVYTEDSIDKTFRQFLELIFEHHDCKDYLDANCICKICFNMRHSCEFSDNYGFGVGRVTATCVRCGYTNSFYDDTGSDC